MQEYIVKSWLDLQEKLFEDTYNMQIARYRSNYIFRGVSNSNYSLISSFDRVCGLQSLEIPLLRTFKKYATTNISSISSFWEMISIAQHHGLPTRLLDWTFSPYVALHFMTSNLDMYNTDGAIWCVDFIAANQFLPISLQKTLKTQQALFFTSTILNETVADYTDLSLLENEIKGMPFLIFLEPPSVDDRIINQYALFSMMSRTSLNVDSWLENKNICKKLIVPCHLKLEIRDKLDQINITERVLFPGLDGICSWLARHYKPMNGKNRMDKIEQNK